VGAGTLVGGPVQEVLISFVFSVGQQDGWHCDSLTVGFGACSQGSTSSHISSSGTRHYCVRLWAGLARYLQWRTFARGSRHIQKLSFLVVQYGPVLLWLCTDVWHMHGGAGVCCDRRAAVRQWNLGSFIHQCVAGECMRSPGLTVDLVRTMSDGAR